MSTFAKGNPFSLFFGDPFFWNPFFLFFWFFLSPAKVGSLEMQPGAKLQAYLGVIILQPHACTQRFRLRILRRTRSNAGRTSAGSLSGRIESIWETPSKERDDGLSESKKAIIKEALAVMETRRRNMLAIFRIKHDKENHCTTSGLSEVLQRSQHHTRLSQQIACLRAQQRVNRVFMAMMTHINRVVIFEPLSSETCDEIDIQYNHPAHTHTDRSNCSWFDVSNETDCELAPTDLPVLQCVSNEFAHRSISRRSHERFCWQS